jgi:hypothetical protein
LELISPLNKLANLSLPIAHSWYLPCPNDPLQ